MRVRERERERERERGSENQKKVIKKKVLCEAQITINWKQPNLKKDEEREKIKVFFSFGFPIF